MQAIEQQQRDLGNEAALLGLDKLPHITGGLEGYAYVHVRVPGRAPVIHISLAGCEDSHRHRGDMRRPSRK